MPDERVMVMWKNQIAYVTVTLPQFWKSNLTLRFVGLEANFKLKLTKRTKIGVWIIISGYISEIIEKIMLSAIAII